MATHQLLISSSNHPRSRRVGLILEPVVSLRKAQFMQRMALATQSTGGSTTTMDGVGPLTDPSSSASSKPSGQRRLREKQD